MPIKNMCKRSKSGKGKGGGTGGGNSLSTMNQKWGAGKALKVQRLEVRTRMRAWAWALLTCSRQHDLPSWRCHTPVPGTPTVLARFLPLPLPGLQPFSPSCRGCGTSPPRSVRLSHRRPRGLVPAGPDSRVPTPVPTYLIKEEDDTTRCAGKAAHALSAWDQSAAAKTRCKV